MIKLTIWFQGSNDITQRHLKVNTDGYTGDLIVLEKILNHSFGKLIAIGKDYATAEDGPIENMIEISIESPSSATLRTSAQFETENIRLDDVLKFIGKTQDELKMTIVAQNGKRIVLAKGDYAGHVEKTVSALQHFIGSRDIHYDNTLSVNGELHHIQPIGLSIERMLEISKIGSAQFRFTSVFDSKLNALTVYNGYFKGNLEAARRLIQSKIDNQVKPYHFFIRPLPTWNSRPNPFLNGEITVQEMFDYYGITNEELAKFEALVQEEVGHKIEAEQQRTEAAEKQDQEETAGKAKVPLDIQTFSAQTLERKIAKFNHALDKYEWNINTRFWRYTNNDPKAQLAACTLVALLRHYARDLSNDLDYNKFIASSYQAYLDALPKLENDLSWCDVLLNILREISVVFLFPIYLCTDYKFFEPVEASIASSAKHVVKTTLPSLFKLDNNNNTPEALQLLSLW